MRISGLVLATLIVCFAVEARRAEACGGAPPAYWTWEDPGPQIRGPIPTDGAILLPLKPWADVFPERAAEEAVARVRAVVRDQVGRVVPGSVHPWRAARGPAVAWRPDEPLAPGVTFDLEAELVSQQPRPAGASGATSLTTRFSSGDGPAQPITLSGELGVAVETFDMPQFKNCLCFNCEPNGTARAARLRVTVGAVEGGSASEGYTAWLYLTRDAPFTEGGLAVLLDGQQHVLPVGQSTDLFVHLPAVDPMYRPCVTVRVLDPAGNQVDRSTCLERLDVRATIKQLDGEGSGAGCSMARPSGQLPLVLVGIWLLTVGRIRRCA